MNTVNILGVKVNPVSMEETLEIVEEWISTKKKYYIVTPNPEFIIAAQKDKEFQEVLNLADLAIPDSARLSWASKMLSEKSVPKRVTMLPFVILPGLLTPKSSFPVTTGTDLVDNLCRKAKDWGVTVGFLGGQKGVAIKAAECLSEKYPGLKVAFAEDGPEVDLLGREIVRGDGGEGSRRIARSEVVTNEDGRRDTEPAGPRAIYTVDILFVAFGQVKQEKWIAKNLDKLSIKVAVGVGGAFDYISGITPRAPKLVRDFGFEWLFRLILQPWRIKRQLALIKFIRGVLLS